MSIRVLLLSAAVLLTGCGGGGSQSSTNPPGPQVDSTPPVVTTPVSITVAAVDGNGTPASDAAITAFLSAGSANDDVDGAVSVTTDAPDVFPLNDTTVTFSATDAAGNTSTATATVSVTDQAAPILTAPADIAVTASSGSGVAATDADIAVFLAAASAIDNVDETVIITNNALTTFPIGDTTVIFSASDAAGNAAESVTAVVTVAGEVQAGNAVKGPLHMATVFFDYNGNGELDSDEPATVTSADGSYTLAEDSGAPESYHIIVEFGEETIDSTTGESYADSDVKLKAAEGGSIVSPMTSLHSHSQTSIAGGEGAQAHEFAAVLGIPDGIDILNYNQYAVGVDPEEAAKVEKIAQKIMLAAQMITEAIQGAGSSGSTVFPAALAREAAFDALVKTVIEVNAIRKGGTSATVTSATGLLDLSDPLILKEIEEFVAEDIRSGDLATEIAAAGLTVNLDVVDYVLEKSSQTIAKIAAVVDTLAAGDLGGVGAAAISALKHEASDEIFATSTAALAFITEGNALDTFDVTQYLTLNTDEAINALVDEAESEAEGFLVEQLNLVDTDDDGRPDTCDTACLAYGLTEDLDDDGDNVADTIDAFPLDASETIDTDSDGLGNNADTDDDGDGVADTADVFPLDPTESTDTDNDGIGDNSDTDNGGDSLNVISGRVIDGYISGANAFLDLNFDGELSSGEPSALSAADGLFQFSLSDTDLSCAAYVPTVVNVPVGAVDLELGVIDQAYKMVLPPRFSALTPDTILNISPITSVVWEAFEAELNASLKELTCSTILASEETRTNLAAVLERSIADVVTHYNISEEQLFEDFIAEENDDVKAKAVKIVAGLKKSLAETISFQAQYPNATWAKVNYYFFSSLDGDDLYPNAWYRDVELYDGDTIVKEVIKVSDDLSEEIRPILYEKTTVSSVGGFGVREEIGYESRGGDDSGYSCNYKEEVSISNGGVEYQLVNVGGESNVLGIDSCQLPDFATQSSSRYVFYRAIVNGVDSGAQFTFFSDDGEFPALNEWTNLLKGLSDLEADELVFYAGVLPDYVESLPYGFCESGDGSADLVNRSRSFMVSGDQITLNRSEDGTYERITTFSDGTSQTELSTIDSVPGWDNCSAPDYDADGSPNSIDPDDDNDGVRDVVDAFPLDYSEQLDTDGDGIGNNTDKDDDNDGVEDNYDQYPLDSGNIIDSDGDGIVDREDVFPNDASSFKTLRMDFSASSSLGLGSALSAESNVVAAAIPQTLKSDRTLLKLIADIFAPKAWASDVTLSSLTNAITWDDQGSIVLDTILSSETLFVAEAAVTPDGHYLYLLTSNHMQRAISGLDPEVCSIYRVTLSDYSFDCLLTTEEGDIEPKSLQGTMQTDSSRRGMDFRADGAAVMKGFDWNRELPEGVPGGTNSTIAWFMSAKGELIPLAADDGFFAVGALWLNDDYFAVAEYPFIYSDDSLNRQGVERLAIYEADTLTRVKEVISPNIWGPIVRVNGDLHWLYGGSLDGESMEIQQSIVEGIPYTDITGTRLFGLTDYRGVDNTLTSSDGSIVLPLSDGVATTYNWSRGSGTGTDVSYNTIAFSQDYIAYIKAYGPSAPIVSIDGQVPSGTLTLSGGRGEMTINGHQFFFAPDESVNDDLVITYQVDVNGSTASRVLTISAATIANWRADTSRPSVDSDARIEDAGLKWASPEPDEEGICVYSYSSNTSTCTEFDDYDVLSTDMESFRSTRYDDGAVYPNGMGNAYPGISNVFLVDNQLRVFFKDSSDHSYYQAQVDVNTFFADGVEAFNYTPAINGAGEQNIISDATSLTPLSALTLDNVSLTTNDLLSYTIEFGQSLSAYAPLPYFSVSNEYDDIPLAREVEWSEERDSATITITGQGLVSDVNHKVEVLDPIFLANSVRRYELSEDLIFTPSGINNFKLLGGSIELIDYNPLTQEAVTNSVSVLSSNGVISADMRDAPLNLLNIRNAETGGDFNSPTLSFGIERLPVGEGSVSVTIDLKDGIDAILDDNERRVFVEITANWVSDGVNATFTIPEQTISAFYINRAGTRVDIEVDNIDSDMISIDSNGANYPSTLNVKWLAALNKIDFLTPSSLLAEGDYHVTVTTTLPMVDANNVDVTEINIIFSIAENNHFRLMNNIVQVVDYDPSTNGFTSTDVVLQSTGNVISADLRDTPLNLKNLENAASGGDFYSPTLSFGLAQLAVGEGSFVLEIDLIDGEDSDQSDSERRVSAALAVNWISDGVSATFSVPAQTVNLTYTGSGGTSFDVEMTNLDADILRVTSGGADYPDSLNMKLLSLLSKIDFVLPSSLLSEGDFYLNVSTDMPLTNSVNESITELRIWFSVAK